MHKCLHFPIKPFPQNCSCKNVKCAPALYFHSAFILQNRYHTKCFCCSRKNAKCAPALYFHPAFILQNRCHTKRSYYSRKNSKCALALKFLNFVGSVLPFDHTYLQGLTIVRHQLLKERTFGYL